MSSTLGAGPWRRRAPPPHPVPDFDRRCPVGGKIRGRRQLRRTRGSWRFRPGHARRPRRRDDLPGRQLLPGKGRRTSLRCRKEGQDPFRRGYRLRAGYGPNTFNADGLRGTCDHLDGIIGGGAMCAAIRVDARFEYVKTRSVPRQRKPYPPLVESKTNPPSSHDVSGSLVGFGFPTTRRV